MTNHFYSRRKFIGHSALTLLMVGTPSTALADTQGNWSTRADLPLRVQEIYPAAHRGRIWLAGGLHMDEDAGRMAVSSRSFIYDPQADLWAEGPSLPRPLHHPQLISDGSTLFLAGGFTPDADGIWQMTRDLYRLDENAMTWEPLAPMPIPQAETLAAVIDGRLHLASGRSPAGAANSQWNDQTDVALHQVYDPASDIWGEAAPVPMARNSAAGVLAPDGWYVIGGRTVAGGNTPRVDRYDPATDSWREMPAMPEGRGGTAAGLIGDTVHLFGGEWFDSSGGGVYRPVLHFNLTKQVWTVGADMPVPRHGLGAVTLRNTIYVVGGAIGAGGNGTTRRLSTYRR